VSEIEISEAATEAALTWLRSFFTIDEALIDQCHKDSLAQAFDAHAATATAAGEARVADQLQKAREACDIAFHVICNAINHGMPITKNVADARNMTAEVYREWQAELQPTPEATGQ